MLSILSRPQCLRPLARLSYVQVIQASPTLSRDSSRDPSLHAVESASKSPDDDHLEDYYEADEEEDGNESEFVVVRVLMLRSRLPGSSHRHFIFY